MSASLIRVDTELPFNLNPRFTTWLASSGALHEPFVLVDAGVLGASILAERDSLIAEHKHHLAERDEKIAQHERLLAEQTEGLVLHERFLAERDHTIAEHALLVADRDRTIADQRRLLAERDTALAAIQDSRSWRLTAPLRDAMNWLRC